MSGRTLRSFPDPVLIVGGKAVITGTTTISVEPVACKNSTKAWPLITQEDISVDLSSNGLNGLDEGAIQVSTTYYLYIIKSRQFINDLPSGFVFSLSALAPSFPHASNIEKYDLYRQVGTFKTDSTGQIEETGLTFLIKGVVSVYADLPVIPDDVLDVYLVRTGTGIWLVNRKPAGLYNWNGSAWVHMSSFPNQFNTTNFELFDNADNSKRLKINITALATSTIRNIIMPDKDVDLDNVRFSKFDAIVAPTVNNDNTEGYIVGSRWVNVALDIEYACLDASTGAAFWTITTTKFQRIGWRMAPASNGFIPLLGWNIQTATAENLTSASPVDMGEEAFHSHAVIDVSAVSGEPFTIRITGRSIDEVTGAETAADTEDINITANGFYQSSKSWLDDVQFSIVEAAKSCTVDIFRTTYWDRGNSDFKIIGARMEWVPGVFTWSINLHFHKINNDGSETNIDDITFANTDAIPRASNGNPGKYKRGGFSTLINGAGNEGLVIELNQTNINNFYVEIQYTT